MGMNLRSCCHKCKEQIFHYRKKEQKTLLPFYSKHYSCMKENPENIETKEDQIQREDWMDGNGEYTEVSYNKLITDKVEIIKPTEEAIEVTRTILRQNKQILKMNEELLRFTVNPIGVLTSNQTMDIDDL